MDSSPDYYAALRVGPGATQQEISRAYRTLMRSHHPDVDDAAADREVKDNELLMIMQAFSVLRDPARREAYDRSITGRQESGTVPRKIPVRKVHRRSEPSPHTIRITPVRWESGPWA